MALMVQLSCFDVFSV